MEILLTYPEDTQALRQRAMTSRARQMPWCSLSGPISSPLRPAGRALSLVREHVRARPDGGSTAWDALLGDGADSEGWP